MAKKEKKGKQVAPVVVEEKKVEPVVVETVVPVVPVVATGEEKKAEEPKVKTGYYNSVTAKAYRDKIHAEAIAGGHIFKVKGQGTGTTIKKISKTGTAYYYQPWSQLSEDQKKQRLDAAKKRDGENRELARKYREEHPAEVKDGAKA
jgi:hypothetical protein